MVASIAIALLAYVLLLARRYLFPPLRRLLHATAARVAKCWKQCLSRRGAPVHRNIGPRVAAGHKSLKINGANVADADVQLEA